MSEYKIVSFQTNTVIEKKKKKEIMPSAVDNILKFSFKLTKCQTKPQI
jgi:hypothetical protein